VSKKPVKIRKSDTTKINLIALKSFISANYRANGSRIMTRTLASVLLTYPMNGGPGNAVCLTFQGRIIAFLDVNEAPLGVDGGHRRRDPNLQVMGDGHGRLLRRPFDLTSVIS
jgi:hypothetical protein